MCTALIDRNSLNHIFLCGGIGHWMWKHLVGITPAAPGFARATIAPRIHDSVGPRSVGGRFLSPKGMISSSWAIGPAADTVRCENGSFLRHHIYCKPNICQDRLGTNEGKLKNRESVSRRLSVGLPVGVGGGTIIVPKPTKAGQPAATALITLGGEKIWDGAKLLGTHAGILSAQDGRDGVIFTTTNGKFEFVSSAAEFSV